MSSAPQHDESTAERDDESNESVYDEAEAKLVAERLQALGYIE